MTLALVSNKRDVVAELTSTAMALEGDGHRIRFPARAKDAAIRRAAKAIMSETESEVSCRDLGALLYYCADIMEGADNWRTSHGKPVFK